MELFTATVVVAAIAAASTVDAALGSTVHLRGRVQGENEKSADDQGHVRPWEVCAFMNWTGKCTTGFMCKPMNGHLSLCVSKDMAYVACSLRLRASLTRRAQD